jgi:hypothetical protein
MTRSQEQNKRLWAMLGDVSRQVQWHVDGRMVLMDAEDWKHVFTAALKKHQRIAAGIDGGFVILGQSTRRMTVAEMGDLMTLIEAFGAERNVEWSDPDWQSQMKEYGKAA